MTKWTPREIIATVGPLDGANEQLDATTADAVLKKLAEFGFSVERKEPPLIETSQRQNK